MLQVSAWLTSSATSMILSIFVIQPAKAIAGSFLISGATTAAAASAVAAFMMSAEVAA